MKYQHALTKIICTIGPATWDPEVMKACIENGMDVARINGAFADQEEMLKVERLVREVSDDVAMMIDIKGPEVRLNKFASAIDLAKDMQLEIGSGPEFNIYPANYPDIYQKLTVGQPIAVGDGDVRLEVTEIKEKSFIVKVLYGETLKPGKALNFPGTQLNDNPLTERDKELLTYAMERNWEFVSASFIRNKKDAELIRSYLGDSKIEVIAKIEDAEGVKNIDEILTVVDGVMVARGGLGVEMGLEKVPVAQRRIIAAANAAGKPVITATQMLDSMERNLIPTRAEANDVATAVLLGSDAVMLSGESTAGRHPIEAVEFLSKVDQEVRPLVPPLSDINTNPNIVSGEQIEFSKQIFDLVAKTADLAAVVYYTNQREQVGVLSRYALAVPLYTFAPDKVSARQMNLRRGVSRSFAVEQSFTKFEEVKAYTYAVAKELGIATTGNKLLVVANYQAGISFAPAFEIVTAG